MGGDAGYPTAERAIRGSTNIETLSDEDQELLRVACKAIFTLIHVLNSSQFSLINSLVLDLLRVVL